MNTQATNNQPRRATTLRQTLEQKRGKQAWGYTEAIKGESERRKEEALRRGETPEEAVRKRNVKERKADRR